MAGGKMDKKRVLLISCLLFFYAVPSAMAQRTFTMQTAVPTPSGDFYRIKLMDNGDPATNLCTTGEIALFGNSLYRCVSTDTWTLLGGVWTQDDATETVYLSDLSSHPNLGVAIGSGQKEMKLTIDNDGGILAKGAFDSGQTLTTTGAGTRLIWYPRKSAFRAGTARGNEWSANSIGNYSFAAGLGTTASGVASFVGGGDTNAATGTMSMIGGGQNNLASGNFATVAGGGNANPAFGNVAQGNSSTVGGGSNNKATGQASTVAGGDSNQAIAYMSFIGGGLNNAASGSYSAILGGWQNMISATGGLSSVLGGSQVNINGANSIGAGRYINVNGTNSFVYGHYISAQDINWSNTFAILSNTAIGHSAPSSFPNLLGKLTVWGDPNNANDVAVYMDDLMQIKARQTAPACTGLTDAGKVYVDSDSFEFCFCDGIKWTGLKANGACN